MNPFKKDVANAWCPGCGNFAILNAIQAALHEEGIRPQDTFIISGIGQAAKLPHYISVNGYNGLHGRALPAAMGAHAANPNLKVIVTSGDGDTYGEGGNHFLHHVRRNVNMLHLVHDNQVYGLTKGQGSPTTAFGQITTLQQDGVKSQPVNPVLLALSLGATFVARAYSQQIDQLKELIKAGLHHPGYALIDIFQPCVSFNKVNTYQWYSANTTSLPEDYDPTNLSLAIEYAQKQAPEIPLGILYQVERPHFMQQQSHLDKPIIEYQRQPEDIKRLLVNHR